MNLDDYVLVRRGDLLFTIGLPFKGRKSPKPDTEHQVKAMRDRMEKAAHSPAVDKDWVLQ